MGKNTKRRIGEEEISTSLPISYVTAKGLNFVAIYFCKSLDRFELFQKISPLSFNI